MASAYIWVNGLSWTESPSDKDEQPIDNRNIEVEEEFKACPTNCNRPVCGIDNKTYCNSCGASLAGVEIASEGPCK